jgi:hypothetical protein
MPTISNTPTHGEVGVPTISGVLDNGHILTAAAEDFVIIPSAPRWTFERDEFSLSNTKKRSPFGQKAKDLATTFQSKIKGVKGAREQGVPLQGFPQK